MKNEIYVEKENVAGPGNDGDRRKPLGKLVPPGKTLTALLKAPVIALSVMILCLPSLYVFSSIAGNPISIPQCFAIGGATLAIIGLMLLGMVPVTWLFSISTESIPFVVVLNTGIWLIAVIFARRFLKLAKPGRYGVSSGGCLFTSS